MSHTFALANRMPTTRDPSFSSRFFLPLTSGRVVGVSDGDTISVLHDGKAEKIRLNGIIVDVNMPDMNGFELLTEVKQLQPQTPYCDQRSKACRSPSQKSIRMQMRIKNQVMWVVLWGILLGGCLGYSPALDLSSMDPSQDQWRIAEYYSQEAARLRQRAQDMDARALLYERLFGAESEWVSGTRLLAQAYEDAASEHEGLAKKHLELAGGRSP